MSKRLLELVAVFALVALFASTVQAFSSDVDLFKQAYPQATGLANCGLCHPGNQFSQLNSFGVDFKAAGRNFAAIESKDSDGDGFSNIDEIKAGTHPGDAASKPVVQAQPGTEKPPLYSDLKGHWARAAVEAMAAKGVVKGYPDGTFGVDGKVSRAEFAAFVQRILSLPEVSPYLPTFTDVPKGSWYYGVVETASASGFMPGVKARSFEPDTPVDRETAARVVVTALGRAKEAQELSQEAILAALGKFSDLSAVSEDARPYLAVAVSRGILQGFDDGTLRPKQTITRAEAIALLQRMDAQVDRMVALSGLNKYAVGNLSCAGCHPAIYKDWKGTAHGMMIREATVPGAAWGNFETNTFFKFEDVKLVLTGLSYQRYIGEVDGVLTYLPANWYPEERMWKAGDTRAWQTACASCHTVGYNRATSTFVDLSVGCETCHGPGSAHVATGRKEDIRKSLGNEMCAPCHSGAYRQIDQLEAMGHFTIFEKATREPHYSDSCLKCHSATYIRAKGEKPTWQDFKTGDLKDDRIGITCVVCHDPHKNHGHTAQLYVDVQTTCVQCHNASLGTASSFALGRSPKHPQYEMFLGKGGIGTAEIPSKKVADCVDCHMTAGNHLFRVGTPIVELPGRYGPVQHDSCAKCHTSITAEQVEEHQKAVTARVNALGRELGKAKSILDQLKLANANVSALEPLYLAAYTNVEFVKNDKSWGMHNPSYANELLRVAEEKLAEFNKLRP